MTTATKTVVLTRAEVLACTLSDHLDSLRRDLAQASAAVAIMQVQDNCDMLPVLRVKLSEIQGSIGDLLDTVARY